MKVLGRLLSNRRPSNTPQHSIARVLSGLIVAGAIVVGVPAVVSADCGFCGLSKYWGGVTNGSYKFDASVPEHVQQAAHFADYAGWGAHFYHPSGEMTITVNQNLSFPVTGMYTADNNTVHLAPWLVDECVSACNLIISVINHEWGHSLGYDHFETGEGCSGSVMAHDRDRNNVYEPSTSDMCSQMAWSEYCEPGADPRTCTPYMPLHGPRDTARLLRGPCVPPATLMNTVRHLRGRAGVSHSHVLRQV